MYAQAKLRKIVGITTLANILTWYEFSLYMELSYYTDNLFFPPRSSEWASLVQNYLVFAIGFLTRPLGVLFFAHIGDKVGRKNALVISIALMTIPTFLTGLIPTYAAIGIAAPLLLALMRFLQGFCTGGELAGTMCYLYEISPRATRTLFGSFSFFGAQLGHILSGCEFLLLQRFFSAEEMIHWGWRISFLVGGLIGLLGWYLRRQLTETPLFETERTEGKTSQKPLLEAFRGHKREMGKAFFLSALALAGWYMLFIFSQTYFKEILQFNTTQLLYTFIIMFLFSACLMPFIGYFGDSSHRKALFYLSGVGIIAFSFPLYISAIKLSYLGFMTFQLVMIAFLTIQFSLLPTILCEMFPIQLRYSCVGLSYNFSNLVFGTAIPILALALTVGKGHLIAPAFLMIFASGVSLWAFSKVKQERTSTH